MKMVGVTACPTGIAHTYMAAEKLAETAKKIVEASVSDTIHNTEDVLNKAIAAANDPDYPLYTETKSGEAAVQEEAEADTFINLLKKIPKHLMTGVSYMIPFVAAGGILIAISYMFGIDASGVEGSLPYYLNAIGQKAFSVMIPIMSGFIAYSMADRPGIAPGLAADLELTETFVRMGVDELSVAPPAILKVREKIRNIRAQQ